MRLMTSPGSKLVRGLLRRRLWQATRADATAKSTDITGEHSQGSGHQFLPIHEAFPQHSEAQIGAGLGAHPTRDDHRSETRL